MFWKENGWMDEEEEECVRQKERERDREREINLCSFLLTSVT